MPSARPLSRASLSNQIRDVLLERIMSGELKPGDRLIELKIAAEMTTSQAPVREAIRELEAMGVIETIPNKGARVRIITNEELQQLYDVRAQIEGYATGLVASLMADPDSEKAISIHQQLQQCLRHMKRVAGKGDSLEFSEYNSEFHRLIVEASGNHVLLDVWSTLNVKARTMANVSRSRRNLLDAAESHKVIIEALKSGKANKASKAARDHVLLNKLTTESLLTTKKAGANVE